MNILKNNKKGFTLVETLVAITILVIGTLGPITIAAQGVAAGGYAKDQITAYYLAQEGIEFIRNVRDTNALSGNSDWIAGLDGPGQPDCTKAQGCTVDVMAGTVDKCQGSGCKFLRTDPNGYYGYSNVSGSKVTVFKRTVKILSTASPDIKTVQVKMDWTSRNSPRTFTLQEDIYNLN